MYPETATAHNEAQLFQVVSTCINTIGYKQTIHALNHAQKNYAHEALVYFVSEKVCLSLGINVSSLETKSGEVRNIAIGFIVYFLKEVFEYKMAAIRLNINVKVTQRMLNIYCAMIKNAKIKNPKVNRDFIIAAKLHYLNNVFINHKKSLSDAKE